MKRIAGKSRRAPGDSDAHGTIKEQEAARYERPWFRRAKSGWEHTVGGGESKRALEEKNFIKLPCKMIKTLQGGSEVCEGDRVIWYRTQGSLHTGRGLKDLNGS